MAKEKHPASSDMFFVLGPSQIQLKLKLQFFHSTQFEKPALCFLLESTDISFYKKVANYIVGIDLNVQNNSVFQK